MKKKIFSSLLIAAFGFAVTSSVVSCKDYDDDINDLQSQINKLATQDALTNMQNTLNSAIEGAKSTISTLEGKLANYATKAELGEVEKLAKGAQTAAESAGTAAANAQKAADDAAALAKAANDLAGNVKTAAGTAQETADKAKRIAEEALANAAIADGKGQQGIDNAKTALEKALKGIEDAQKAAEVAADALAAGNQGVSDADKARVIAQEAKDLADQLKKGTEAFVTKAALAEEISKATAQFSPVAENASKALELAQKADGVASQALQKAEQALAAAGSTPSTPGLSKDEVAGMIKEVADKLTEAQGLISAAAVTAQGTADDALKLAGQAIDDAAAAATLGQQGIDDAAAAATLGQQGIDDAAAAMAAVTSLTQAAYTKAEAETLQGTVDGLVADLAKAATKEELAAVSGETGSVKATVEELFQAVTNVEVYTSLWGNLQEDDKANSNLIFVKVEEVDGVFPKNALGAPEKDANGNQYTFKKGDIKTFTDSIIVRVSPSNADLAAAKAIQLINSQGNNLDDFVKVQSVKQYNKLLTRASNASGLWVVTYKLLENYTPDDFIGAVQENKKNILFAVGVQNTSDVDNSRMVCSSYDVVVGASEAKHAGNGFYVKGLDGWKNVEDVHNRYLWCEDYNKEGNHLSTEEVPEYDWKTPTDKIKTPASVVILEGDNQNVDNRTGADDRQAMDFLPVNIDEPIEICIDGVMDEKGNVVPNNSIKGFIVELDEKFALESDNSELAGWKYYQYDNLNVLQKGNLGYVTIKDLKDVTPEGDFIGFRVYAVNLDGTIVNPDGRAFYVKVTPGADINEVSLDITATKRGTLYSDTNYVVKDNMENGLLAGNYVLTFNEDVEAYPKDPHSYSVNFLDKDGNLVQKMNKGTSEVEFKKDDVEKITAIQFETSNIAWFYDGQTYDQKIKVYDDNHILIQVINCHMTKVMPTAVKDPQFRPMQEVDPTQALPTIKSKEGSNAFIAFMIPNTYKWAAPWTFQLPSKESYEIQGEYADNGWKNLNNIFYNLNDNENYRFDFKTSYTTEDGKKDQDLKEILYGNFFNSNPEYAGYWLAVQDEYIDGKTWHDVVLSGVYPGVSSYIAKDKSVKFGEDYSVPSSTKYQVMYACWHDAATWAWGVDKNKKSLQPKLQWEANATTPQEAKANAVLIKSGYNADVFEGTLEGLIKKNFIKINTEKEPVLTYGTQVNPYFKPTVDEAGKITFTQVDIQSDANPTADHPEDLTINFLDAYGHEVAVTLKVQILKAKASAAKGI